MKRPLAAVALLALSGCTHYWERPEGTAADFERESAACIDETRQSSQLSYDAREQIYRACMRSRGWKRVEVSVADDNQYRGPESVKDFINPPPALSGRRYQQTGR
jgi:hypothetical protein